MLLSLIVVHRRAKPRWLPHLQTAGAIICPPLQGPTEAEQTLIAMGFSPEESSRAATAAGGDIERALQHLLDPDLAAAAPPHESGRLPGGPVMSGSQVAIVELKSRCGVLQPPSHSPDSDASCYRCYFSRLQARPERKGGNCGRVCCRSREISSSPAARQ